MSRLSWRVNTAQSVARRYAAQCESVNGEYTITTVLSGAMTPSRGCKHLFDVARCQSTIVRRTDRVYGKVMSLRDGVDRVVHL